MDRGTARETIEKNLLSNGWDANDLKEAFALVSNVNAEVPASATFKNTPVTQAPASASISASSDISQSSSGVNVIGLGNVGAGVTSGMSSNPMGELGGFAPGVTKMADINPVPGTINPGVSQVKPMASQFAQTSKPLPSFSGGMNMSGINPLPAQNFASVKPAVSQVVKSGGVMGYVWVALIFLIIGAGGGFYASRNLFPVTQPVADNYTPPAQVTPPAQNIPAEPAPVLPISETASTTATTTANNLICAQVITKAKDPKTKVIKEFSTPCDVPTGWEVVPPASTSTSVSPLKPVTR